MKILLIDDFEEWRKIYSRELTELGHEVFVAEDGLQGIKIIEDFKNNLNLVITDCEMPNLSGKEVIQFVKANYPTIKTILMSATFSTKPADWAKEQKAAFHAKYKGVDDLLTLLKA